MEAKVSVIVPVYNVELYLEACLESIIGQTFKEIEIILVNDGSTDGSPGIMTSYASKDSRIRVLNQANRGVSVARNTGLEHASGEYILFVDSDDTILPNTIEVLYRKAGETGADLVMGNALYCYPDESRSLSVDFIRNERLNNGSLRTGEAAFMELMEWNKFPPLSCLYFIRRDLIIDHRLYFQPGIIHEDNIWCLKAILSAQKVLLLDFNYYLYRQREGSIMRSDNYDYRIRSLFEAAKALNQFAEELQKKEGSGAVVTWIYVRIFRFCFFIGEWVYRQKTLGFSGFNYFSELLIKVYPDLSYFQQRQCLNLYCGSMVLSKLKKETV